MTQTNLRIPEDTVEAIDSIRGMVPRSTYVVAIAQWVLDSIPHQAKQSHLRAAWETRPAGLGTIASSAGDGITIQIGLTISEEMMAAIDARRDQTLATSGKKPSLNQWWSEMLRWCFTRLPHEADRAGLIDHSTDHGPQTIGL